MAAKTRRVEVVPRSPLADAAKALGGALSLTVAYNVRAALGQQFNPKLIEDADKLLRVGLHDYASAIVAEVRRK